MIRLTSAALAVLVTVTASATNAEDKLVGASWEIKPIIKGEKPAPLRVLATPDGKVYDLASTEIGSWKGDMKKVEMKITGLTVRGKLNGTYALTNIANGPVPRWTGKWTSSGGDKSVDVVVRLLKD